MNNKIFRIIPIFFLLTILLFPLTSCGDGYERFTENGLEIAYNSEKKDALIGKFTWSGDIEETEIVIPNTYKDAPVTSLGGYVITSLGMAFSFNGVASNSTEELYFNKMLYTQKEVDEQIKKVMSNSEIQDYVIRDLVFNLSIGNNLNAITVIMEDSFYKGFICNLDTNDAVIYVVTFNVQVDPQNQNFYSDELGRMYYKSTNKLVTSFLYHNRDSFPENSL